MKWIVSAYYRADVELPREPEGLAIETIHTTKASADTEVAAARSRPEIGRVHLTEIEEPRDRELVL